MLTFLQQLRQRYGLQPESPQREQRLDSLSLAIAALCRLERLETGSTSGGGGPPPPPLQIVVIGPTQSGKSTLVNLLAGDRLAGVSALAGFTRHAHGFGLGVDDLALAGLEQCLRPGRRVPAEELTPDLTPELTADPAPDRLDRFALSALPDSRPFAAPAVLWDTPDFDSVAAHQYRHSVLTVAAQAEQLVMIASRDKYGDLSVWRTLELIAPLRPRLLLVINKVTPGTEAELRRHIEDELEQRLAGIEVTLLMLPYSAELGRDAGLEPELDEALGRLRTVLDQGLQPDAAVPAVGDLRTRIADLLEVHWGAWIQPLRAEHSARAQWQELIDRQLDAMLEHYRQDFLADSDRYDTFERILAELLTLLEIPGIAQTMGRVRRWVTWPVRQLLDRGGQVLHGGRQQPNNEQKVLQQAGEHLLLELTQTASERSEGDLGVFWRALELRLTRGREELLAELDRAALRHQEDFRSEIESAARRLHERLAEQPRVLNSLRTGRAAADIAGVAIALKTGGIGVSDLLLTPAMLSLTSILTEGALGQYVDRVVADLKDRQFGHVRAHLVDRMLRPRLTALARDLASERLFGVSAERLREAERERRRLRHG